MMYEIRIGGFGDLYASLLRVVAFFPGKKIANVFGLHELKLVFAVDCSPIELLVFLFHLEGGGSFESFIGKFGIAGLRHLAKRSIKGVDFIDCELDRFRKLFGHVENGPGLLGVVGCSEIQQSSQIFNLIGQQFRAVLKLIDMLYFGNFFKHAIQADLN